MVGPQNFDEGCRGIVYFNKKRWRTFGKVIASLAMFIGVAALVVAVVFFLGSFDVALQIEAGIVSALGPLLAGLVLIRLSSVVIRSNRGTSS